ncbi:metal-dependent hydrolase [Zunongwangia endophytica]|uniref:Metal-dependent hydrolase n=1 Tax=Zunongwangia endophytica TaxID=1808945 RepID=A0ABV8H9Q2_9FLAO|nr:metal-dependent hydrolase [Zunongwangia endophytica]MDN3594941.1 metal-dependent hydrolase [Zunongwangia endophytica]
MELTFYGQNCLGLTIGAINVIVDPFISGNENAKGKVELDTIKADFILVTHAHQDHVLDVETVAKNNPKAVIVSNAEIASYYEEKGFNVHPMNHGGSWNFDFGKVKYVQAWHSSTFPDGASGGLPGGFVIQTGEKNLYIAGDTALSMDMKLIPLFTKLDLAVLPIGDNFTMGVDEAIVASDFIECDRIVGCHYDTFGYIEIDHAESKKKFADKGKELLLMEIGEKMSV